MDLYLLNKQTFRRQALIDKYLTLIWTERYGDTGHFVLELEDTVMNREVMHEGMYLQTPDSPETMIIEKRTTKNGILKLEGESLVTILKHRMLRHRWENWEKSWLMGASIGSAAPRIVLDMCIRNDGSSGYIESSVNSPLSAADGSKEIIPNLVLGDWVPDDVVNMGSLTIKHGNVFDAVKEDCNAAEFGFGIYLRDVTETDYALYFETWKGLNRTSKQTANTMVRFDPALDSLTDTTELRSISGYKNVCYVWAPAVEMAGWRIYGKAVAPGSENLIGFDRRTLLIEATDITDEQFNLGTSDGQSNFQSALNRRARDGLANNNYVRYVDGTIIPQNSAYKFGTHYKLGDIIELKTRNGGATPARVVEYIRSMSIEGYKEYPTLSVMDQ